MLAQVMGEQFSIPKILSVAQLARVNAQILFHLLPGGLVQSARAAFPFAFAQAGEAAFFKAMNPPLQRGGMLPEPLGHLAAAMTLANKEDTMQAVIVARLIGTGDLLAEGYPHGFGMGNLKSFHSQHLNHHAGL
jgi:hypothetical protein